MPKAGRYDYPAYEIDECIERVGKSKSTRELQALKNNWDILLNWNENFLISLQSSLPK
jgi:hypothetical protein